MTLDLNIITSHCSTRHTCSDLLVGLHFPILWLWTEQNINHLNKEVNYRNVIPNCGHPREIYNTNHQCDDSFLLLFHYRQNNERRNKSIGHFCWKKENPAVFRHVSFTYFRKSAQSNYKVIVLLDTQFQISYCIYTTIVSRPFSRNVIRYAQLQ